MPARMTPASNSRPRAAPLDTDLVSVLTPSETMGMLNSLFADFDALCDEHGVQKVETSACPSAALRTACAVRASLLSL